MSSNNEPTVLRPGASSTASYTGTAAAATAVADHVKVVRVVCSSDCFVSFTGTATTSDMFIPALTPEYFNVTNGQTPSFIRLTVSGTAYVTDMIK